MLKQKTIDQTKVKISAIDIQPDLFSQYSSGSIILDSSQLSIGSYSDLVRPKRGPANNFGQDNQVFNDFFSTNGFQILSTVSSVDQVYIF